MPLVAPAAPLLGSVPMLEGDVRRPPSRLGQAGSEPDDPGVALVAAVARGERGALAALYDLHAPAVMGLARRMLGDQSAAEDLVHDVFIEMWQHAAEFSPQRGSVRAWLIVRARSRALDRLGRSSRDARALERILLDAAESPVTPGAHTAIDGARVRQRLAHLPPELRDVLDLAYFEGLSATEAAERLGVPAGTVKSRLARALGSLRLALADAPEDGSTDRSEDGR